MEETKKENNLEKISKKEENQEQEQSKEKEKAKEVTVITSKMQMYRANWYHGYNANQRNQKMNRYIFTTKKGIDLINLDEAKKCLDRALTALRKCVAKGGRIMFVGTDEEVAPIVEETAKRCGQSYIAKKWPGGLLTNFDKSFSVMISNMKQTKKKLELDELDGLFNKKEQLKIKKKNDKYFNQLGGVKDMVKLPDMVIITSMREKNAIKECAKKGIPCISLVDTNCNPFSAEHPIKYPVPGNDRSIQTASLFLAYCGDYCLLGLRDENLVSINKEQEKKKQPQQVQQEKNAPKAEKAPAA